VPGRHPLTESYCAGSEVAQPREIEGVTMRRHFLAHRWVWLTIAVVVVVANELIDRNFFDKAAELRRRRRALS